MARPYDAVLFDLLTGLLDSWTLWNAVARDETQGLRWRREYLRLTYPSGAYRPYETIVAEAAKQAGVPRAWAEQLVDRWDELAPWPEALALLGALARVGLPLGVVTNCSESLGRRAAARVGVDFQVVVTAERAGWYKPDPRPYQLALADLAVRPERTLFVAGSPSDLPGASRAGMPVVWHNRIGLPRPAETPPPLAVYSALEPLTATVLGPAGQEQS